MNIHIFKYITSFNYLISIFVYENDTVEKSNLEQSEKKNFENFTIQIGKHKFVLSRMFICRVKFRTSFPFPRVLGTLSAMLIAITLSLSCRE